MKKILIIATILLIFSCDNVSTPKSQASLDTIYSNRYANRFEILASQDSIILRVHNPWQGAQNTSFDYPFSKNQSHSPRIICMSSSHIAYLDALGATENIVGVSGLDFITNNKIQLAKTPDVGYDNNLNYELIVSLKPDYVFVYEVSGENSITTKKLEQLGIPIIYIADYLEQSPLARSEWIIAFGAIIGRSEQAQKIFNNIENRYNQIRDSVERYTMTKPKIMLNTPYRDVWYVPGDRSYIVQLINDAGGDYLAKGVDNDISRPISSEVAYELLSKADIWLHPSIGAKTIQDVISADQRFGSLAVVQTGQLYNNNARSTPMGGSDFWESGSLRADLVLSDLSKIFNNKIFSEYKLYYYHKLE